MGIPYRSTFTPSFRESLDDNGDGKDTNVYLALAFISVFSGLGLLGGGFYLTQLTDNPVWAVAGVVCFLIGFGLMPNFIDLHVFKEEKE